MSKICVTELWLHWGETMTVSDKAISRLKSIPKDYTYTEARSLMRRLGYVEKNKGSTSGSRVMFYRESDGRKILLHKPHPQDIMPVYAVRELCAVLKESGDI